MSTFSHLLVIWTFSLVRYHIKSFAQSALSFHCCNGNSTVLWIIILLMDTNFLLRRSFLIYYSITMTYLGMDFFNWSSWRLAWATWIRAAMFISSGKNLYILKLFPYSHSPSGISIRYVTFSHTSLHDSWDLKFSTYFSL